MLADEFVREGGSVALIDAAEENGARVEYFEEALNAQVGGVSHVHFPDGSVAWWDFDHWRTERVRAEWRQAVKPLLFLLLIATSLSAQERQSKRAWVLSLVAVSAASVLDSHSSWGSVERNPMLRDGRGRFSGRGITIKLGILGGAALTQTLIVRRSPRAAPACAVANWTSAGVLSAAAVGNYRR